MAALPLDVLLGVEKSARYTGGEINSHTKSWQEAEIHFAFCFPDVYDIGMSHLGLAILYEMFNSMENVLCDRVFFPWNDLYSVMKERKLPLFSLESQRAIRDFEFLGFTLQYEMSYTNILGVLDLSGIPFYAADRKEEDPIVIGGGPCAYNPMPIAPFFDVFYIGDGEEKYQEIFDLYRSSKGRKDFLTKAARVEGLYVPGITPEGKIIKRLVCTDMNKAYYPLHPVIPNVQAAMERMVLEIQRGCIRGCRFCQAGFTYRPNRQKNKEVLLEQTRELIKNTGYEEISLSSLSSSDYEELPEFLDELLDICSERMINISLPSLRIDAFSLDVMKKIGDVKKTSITFAPEAGSQRMRDIINKNITRDDIIKGAREAFLGGWTNIKLYFMLGLPFEEDSDILEIADIAEDLCMLFFDTVPKPERNGRVQITVSTSFFVPKPMTPFQWASMCPPGEYKRKASLLKEAIKSKPHGRCISYNWHSPETAILEGVFARGDERVAPVIKRAYELGCIYDAWSENFDYDKWLRAFSDCNLTTEEFTIGEIPTENTLPWDFIDCGVKKRFLLQEWEKAAKGVTTQNCKEGCSGCGCMELNTGICNEHKA